MKYSEDILELFNSKLRDKSPVDVARWALLDSERPIVTTNFRPYEAAILHACVEARPDIQVVWCDTGYNTPQTYRCAEQIIQQLKLNVEVYVPKQTTAWRDVAMGIPEVDDPRHELFSEQVKLEPFRRAMEEHKPDLWFTNLRAGQTALRDTLDILSQSADGVFKVSPFFHYSDIELDAYMKRYELPNELSYFDPTKAMANRECGIHK